MSKSYKVLSRQEKSKLLADVGIEQVLALCNEAKPTHSWERHGNRIRSRCIFPGHSDANPSMDIVFTDDRVFAKCFSCGQYETDGFKIAEHITGIKAVSRLYAEIFGQRFGLKLSPELDDALVQEDLFQHFKESLLTAAKHVLISAATKKGGDYEYAQDAVTYLTRRGFPTSSFMHLGVGIFPTLEHFAAHADNDAQITIGEYLGARVFEQKPKAVGRHGGWLMFPYYTSPTTIGRLKLRDPRDKSNETWLGIHKEETRGFFGLNQFTTLVGQNLEEARNAYVVEGEFDQLSMSYAQLNLNPNEQHIVLGASGAGASDIDLLADSGIKRVTIVGDNDAGGTQFVQRVLEAATQERIHDFSAYDWSTLSQYKDPDEVVQGGDYADLIHGLTSRSDVKELYRWATDVALARIAGLNDPSAVEKIDVLNSGCSFLKNEVERGLYVAEVSRLTGLDTGVLAKHMVPIDTERGFLVALERVLGEHASPVAMDGPEVALIFNKRKKEIFYVQLRKPREIELALQNQLFGCRTYDFVEMTVGIPDQIRFTQGKVQTERPLNSQAKDLSGHIDHAVQSFVAAARPLSKFRIRRQGIHWDDIADDPMQAAALPSNAAPKRVYVVNGHLRLLGEPGRNGLVKYEELHEPVHGLNLLWGDDRAWSRTITSAAAANAKPPLTRRECYDMVLDIVDAWSFERQDLSRVLLAGYLLAINHIDVYNMLPYLMFTAPSQSGKSTFLKGVLRGEDPSDIGLLEHVTGCDDYTAAAIMQSAADSPVLQALDEWENPDDANRNDQKSRAVSTLLASVRNAGGREGMRRSRGGRYGDPLDTRLRFPIAAAGIHPLKEEADRNRWFSLELLSQPGRTPPEEIILKKYGADGIKQLRKSLLLHSLQHAYLDHLAEREIYVEIFEKNLIRTKTTRGAKALAPILTVLKSVGADYLGFGQRYLDYRTDLLHATNTSAERTMFQAVFETNAIVIPGDFHRRSAINILANPDTRRSLSLADCGLYHLPGTNYVIIYAKKLTEILKYNANYRNATNVNQIFSLLKRNAEVMHDPTFFDKRPKVLQHLRQWISNVRSEDLLAVSFDVLDFDRYPASDLTDPKDVL